MPPFGIAPALRTAMPWHAAPDGLWRADRLLRAPAKPVNLTGLTSGSGTTDEGRGGNDRAQNAQNALIAAGIPYIPIARGDPLVHVLEQGPR